MPYTPWMQGAWARLMLAIAGGTALAALVGCAGAGVGIGHSQSPVSRQTMTSSAAGRDIVTPPMRPRGVGGIASGWNWPAPTSAAAS